jgi:nitroreductase
LPRHWVNRSHGFYQDEAATLERILRWRRDVRHFRPMRWTEARIVRLQQAMDLAPSVGNARPWRVIRVEDAAAAPGGA